MRSYDYATRKGIRAVSWEDVAEMSRRLAESLEAEKVDIVLGIARAGLIPATVVAGEIRRELYPIRLTRRINDEIVFKRPRWLVQTPPLGGKTVGIIDEIADTGETLRLARQSAQNAGAGRIVTATMVTHSWAAPRPDIAVVATDELIVWP
ncbi:MAG: phosphoribosyltransferase, partial [Chloroflexota bacterium]